MNRRRFLRDSTALATLLGGGTLLRPDRTLAAQQGSCPLGLQLFTVMTLLEADFEGTLAAIAAIGYREVETIGAFGRDPTAVRELLDRHGLRSPSQHLVPGQLYEAFLKFTRREMTEAEVQALWLREMSIDKVTPIIEEAVGRARVLGQKYIVWQIIWPEQMQTRALLDQFCRALDTAGQLCAGEGLVFNFHNHAIEMQEKDGYVPYQVILESTDPRRVKLEMDFYWAARANADPVEYLEKYPGRFTQCHLKDSTATGEFATVGQGVLDIPRYLEAAGEAGIEHYYVEYDRSDDPMAVVRDAYAYLEPLM